MSGMSSVCRTFVVLSTNRYRNGKIKTARQLIRRDETETNKKKSCNILRLMPIDVITKANLKDTIDDAGSLFDRYFVREPQTFVIIFHRRLNNGLERESVITGIAEMNRDNKANLKHPELAVIVELIKGLSLISIVSNRAAVFAAANGLDPRTGSTAVAWPTSEVSLGFEERKSHKTGINCFDRGAYAAVRIARIYHLQHLRVNERLEVMSPSKSRISSEY
ncbi:THUMP domain-containing protein 1 [Culex quinquefasciatus]|uniref:THUMP domain-containing protein 1 n=1 Tax=Culex quinquefasciatus TaxID=7176 RepID=B0WNQ6_CULQU|nr:THUMP domain-containing protein 1 [Culex quinquefasciatus]|eukprot:XP_001850340.1 THUMP domain-containing protein 1 [Culex quinquefasciatus]